MSLFPELIAVETPVSGFRENLAELQRRTEEWASSISDRVSVSKRDHEIQLNNVIVNYGADAASSAEIQERKRELIEQSVELYYIYPWELASLDKMFSHFNSRLELDERKFAAKRLLLEKIPQKEADLFMRENHIQGSAGGSQKVSYGLRHKVTGELLAAQQYCKSRWMLKKVEETAGVWEGLRLAIKRNVQIYGAATRLQKAFLSEYHPTELMSYVDFSHSLGEYKKTQGFQGGLTLQESYMWVLDEEPKSVMVRDKNGVERYPDLEKVRETVYLNPNKMAGAFGKGVGQTFYGGKLGSRKQLKENGNELFHNDLIMEAIGYHRHFTAGQLKWTKKFDEQ